MKLQPTIEKLKKQFQVLRAILLHDWLKYKSLRDRFADKQFPARLENQKLKILPAYLFMTNSKHIPRFQYPLWESSLYPNIDETLFL